MKKILAALIFAVAGIVAGYLVASLVISKTAKPVAVNTTENDNSGVITNTNKPVATSPSPTNTPEPTNSPTNSPAPTPVNAPSPVNAPTNPTSPETQGPVGVYFLDQNAFKAGTQPYEKLVSRDFDPTGIVEVQVMTALFHGPTADEAAQGLAVVKSGSVGYSMKISQGIASVTLRGTCASGGATYTVANLIQKNLHQFPDIKAIKIFDAQGMTEHPDGVVDSIPTCLEP